MLYSCRQTKLYHNHLHIARRSYRRSVALLDVGSGGTHKGDRQGKCRDRVVNLDLHSFEPSSDLAEGMGRMFCGLHRF
jgi:hypothetical protein